MEGKIYIDGEIGSKVTLESIRNQVLSLGTIDVLNVDINSGGGDVNVGYAIKDYLEGLKKLGVTINTNIVGICASIATVPFLSGDNRSMSSSASMMIHNPWMQTDKPMEAKDFEEAGMYLREEEDKLAKFYASSLQADVNEIKELMKVETRMDLNQSKSIGFVNAKSVEYRAVACVKLNNVNDMTDKNTGLFHEIKASLAKLVNGSDEPAQAATIMLEDGTAVFIESEDGEFVGKSILLEEGGEPLADGDYKLEDGRSLLVADGVITEVMEGEPEVAEDSDEVKDLKAQIETLQAAATEGVSALEVAETANAEMKASIVDINAKVKAMELVTVGGTGKVKAEVRTPVVKSEDKYEGFLNFLKS